MCCTRRLLDRVIKRPRHSREDRKSRRRRATVLREIETVRILPRDGTSRNVDPEDLRLLARHLQRPRGRVIPRHDDRVARRLRRRLHRRFHRRLDRRLYRRHIAGCGQRIGRPVDNGRGQDQFDGRHSSSVDRFVAHPAPEQPREQPDLGNHFVHGHSATIITPSTNATSSQPIICCNPAAAPAASWRRDEVHVYPPLPPPRARSRRRPPLAPSAVSQECLLRPRTAAPRAWTPPSPRGC